MSTDYQNRVVSMDCNLPRMRGGYAWGDGWRRVKALGIVLALLSLSHATFGSTVRGRVADVNGVGVSGVRIEIVQVGGELPPWITFTSADGRYQISDALLFGNLDITPSQGATVFVPRVKSIFDPGNSIVTADFTVFTKSPVEALNAQFDRFGVVLTGVVNPVGFETLTFFEYGTETGPVRRTESVKMSGEADQILTAKLAELVDEGHGGKLRLRVIATNVLGRSESALLEIPLPRFLPRFTVAATNTLVGPAVMAGDVNGSGSMDFFVLDQNSVSGRPHWLSSDLFSWSERPFCLGCEVTPFILGSIFGSGWSDFNGDNRPDMIVVGSSKGGRVLQNTDSGLVPTARFFVALPRASAFHVMDVNADGLADWVLSGDGFRLLTQAQDGSFKSEFMPSFSGDVNNLAVGDVDGDGWLDMVAGLHKSSTVPALVLIHGSETGEFTSDTDVDGLLPVNENINTELGLALTDFDGDGALDILTASRDRTATLVFQILWNDGKGHFNNRHFQKLQNRNVVGFDRTELITGDFDNDGLEEVLLSGNPVYRIQGRGRQVEVVEESELGPEVVKWGRMDADADGRLDLLVVGQLSGEKARVTVMRNGEGATNRPPAAPSGLRMERGTNHMVLRWDVGQGDDKTPSGALTWNVRVGTTPGGADIFSPLSDLTSGRRKILEPGNAGMNRFLNLRSKPGVTRIYWSVQAVDAGYLGGAWSAEREEVLDSNFRLIEVVLQPNGSVRVIGTGAGGEGAVLNVSEDLLTWTPLSPFTRVGDHFEATDNRGRASRGRFYQAR